MEMKNRFAKEKGLARIEARKSKMGEAMYQVRVAIKLGDKTALEKYKKEFMEEAVKRYSNLPEKEQTKRILRSMSQTIEAMSPLYGIPNDLAKDFIDSLTLKEKETIKRAYQYYNDVLLGKRFNQEAQE